MTTIAELRGALAPLRAGARVGLVPTMGALHDGHLALIAAARAECDLVVASVFVNPAQFSDAADLADYPRDLGTDLAVAAAAGVDLVFAPAAAEFYPAGFATWVEPAGAALGLEGADRPGHFRGVATACLKLFALVRPDVAYFGRKDAQQVAVVKQLVTDLNLNSRSASSRPSATVTASRSHRATRGSPPTSGAARSRSRGRSRPATRSRLAPSSRRQGSSPTTSPSPTSTGRRWPSPPRSAAPA